MAHVMKDRVQETSTSTGTGSFTLAGSAAGGFRSFAAVMATNDTCYYCIQDTTNNAFEVGIGTLTASTTLARTTVLASSNANAAVNFAASTKQVFMSFVADRTPDFEPDLSIIFQDIVNEPTPPTSGMKLYTKAVAGRRAMRAVGPAGLDMSLQNSLWANNQIMWNPTNVTAGLWQGTVGNGGVGTFTNVLPTNTNLATLSKRARYASTTTANLAVGQRTNENLFFRGNAANMGGFFFFCRFVVTTWTAGDRLFIGLSNAGAATVTSQPSAANDSVGLCADAGDTALTFLTRNQANATKAAISGQPTLASGQGYDLYIFCAPNSSQIGFRLVNLNTNALIADAIATLTLPTVNVLMSANALMGNAALTTAGNATIDINKIYVETDY